MFSSASVFVCILAIVGAYRQDHRQTQLLNTVTGGDSFPSHCAGNRREDDTASLVTWNFGDNPLTDVRVTIRCSIFSPSATENIGNLAPGAHSELSAMLESNERCAKADNVQPIKDALVATWMIDMNTQNGVYGEMLQFKWMPACKRWSYRYTVDFEGTVQFDETKTPKLAKSQARLYSSGDNRWIGRINALHLGDRRQHNGIELR